MMKKIILIVIMLFFIPAHTFAKEYKYIQIFDLIQHKVVKSIQLTPKIQGLTTTYIESIDDIYSKNNPIPSDRYAIKMPLAPAMKSEKKCLNALIKEVYIIIPKTEPPFIILFEDENKLACFPFKGDVKTLSKALNFNLNYQR